MKAVGLALLAGCAATALLVVFYLPVLKEFWSSEAITLDRPGFIRIWEHDRQPLHELGLLCEGIVGVFVALAVHLKLSVRRRAPAEWH